MRTIALWEMIEDNYKIFDFNYPTLNDDFKEHFEKMFINNFYYENINFEVPIMFKRRLENKLNLIMPSYNKILETQLLEQRILDNYDVVETFEKTGNEENEGLEKVVNKTTNKGKNLSTYADTGEGNTSATDFNYINNKTDSVGENESNANGEITNTKKAKNTERWTRKMSGNIGIQTDANAITQYWTSIRRVEEEIFNELNELFLGVY